LLTGKAELLGEKLAPVTHWPPNISREPAGVFYRVAAVRDRLVVQEIHVNQI